MSGPSGTRVAAETDALTRAPSHIAGLSFQPAATLDQVIEAWTLVYCSYLRTGLIRSNPWRLHTVGQAIQPRSMVVCGRIGGLTVSTLSGYLDQPAPVGLPLDAVYPEELAALRADGRTLMEIGLFADRREHIERSIDALLELMRQVFYFGAAMSATDAVISVRPRHAGFYTRLLGFEQFGPGRPHPLVNGETVVLLHLDGYGKVEQASPPRGLRYFRNNPVSLDSFADRCVLTSGAVRNSVVEEYLRRSPMGVAVG